jgi:hypothetical protein
LRLFSEIPINLALIATSVVVGRFIPAYYDWTDSDQSRPSPLIIPTAIGLLLCAVILFIALPWLPIKSNAESTDHAGKFRFEIRAIVIVTTLVAVLVAIFPAISLITFGFFCYAVALVCLLRFWLTQSRFRWRAVSMMACMYLPFAWLVSFTGSLNSGIQMLSMSAGLPAFLPTALTGELQSERMAGVAWMFTGLEIILGLWIIRQGARWSIAYSILALLISVFGSFILNALLRA